MANHRKLKPFNPKVAKWQGEALEEFYHGDKSLHFYSGGRESAKSYVMYLELEMILRDMLGYKGNILLLRTTKESAKKSIFDGVVDMLDKRMGVDWKALDYADINRGRIEYNGHKIYVESFRADKQSQERLKSFKDLTHVFIEELKELPESTMFDQLLVTMNRPFLDPKSQIFVKPKMICSFNTPEKNHWITRTYYDLEEITEPIQGIDPDKLSGFYKLKMRTGEIPGTYGLTYEDVGIYSVFSTVYDNEVFKQNIIAHGGEAEWKKHLYLSHEKYKTIDPYIYYTDTLGLVASGRSGRIFTDWQQDLSFEEWEKIDAEPFYGLDFGFSSDPTTVTGVKHVVTPDGEKDKIYVHVFIYETQLMTPDLAMKIKQLIPSFAFSPFYADHEPALIAELISYGIHNMTQASKKAGSRLLAVNYLYNFEVHYTYESDFTNGYKKHGLSRELESYHWLMNRAGEPTNEPSDGDDHAIDGIKMSCFTHLHPDNHNNELSVINQYALQSLGYTSYNELTTTT